MLGIAMSPRMSMCFCSPMLALSRVTYSVLRTEEAGELPSWLLSHCGRQGDGNEWLLGRQPTARARNHELLFGLEARDNGLERLHKLSFVPQTWGAANSKVLWLQLHHLQGTGQVYIWIARFRTGSLHLRGPLLMAFQTQTSLPWKHVNLGRDRWDGKKRALPVLSFKSLKYNMHSE